LSVKGCLAWNSSQYYIYLCNTTFSSCEEVGEDNQGPENWQRYATLSDILELVLLKIDDFVFEILELYISLIREYSCKKITDSNLITLSVS